MSRSTFDAIGALERGRLAVRQATCRVREAVDKVRGSIGRTRRALRAYWMSRSLSQQFAAAAAVVVMVGMVALGLWVSDRIKQGIMQNSATSAALFMDSYIAPLAQELATRNEFSPATRAELDQIFKHSAINKRVSAIKIWRPDGVVAYSTWHETIGQWYKPTPNFQRALSGSIAAEFEGHYHEKNGQERTLAAPLLEIYSPVREKNSDRIIAISEFYENGAAIKSELRQAETMTWLVVAFVTATMLLALSGIVSRGSRTIEEQRDRLEVQVVELRSLLARNNELSRRVQRASRRTAVINEKLLRRVGADLHDGPAQLLSLALLRLDALSPLCEQSDARIEASQGTDVITATARQDLEKIRQSLNDAMQELREISAGLALPELGRASLPDVLQMAARAHERKTETRVDFDVVTLPGPVPDELKTCIFRFVQEGLNNAFRHAGGKGQRVTARALSCELVVEVEDKGPGFPTHWSGPPPTGLGLSGMRDRIESLGGTMEVGAVASGGARVTARFDISKLKVTDMHDE